MRRLATVSPGAMEFQEVLAPEASGDRALIDVECVGICGSDLHLLAGDHPYARFPIVQGHEFSGRVVTLPAQYEGELSVGSRVAVEPLLTCGECLPCRRGRTNCCVRMATLGVHVDGGLSQQVDVPVRLLHHTPALRAELAALVEPASIGLHALRRAGLRSAEQIAIYGAGPIGLTILLAARDLGIRAIVIDRLEGRLELASRLGAEQVTIPQAAPVDIARWTNNDGPLAIFDATGVPTVLRAAVDAIAPSGTIVVVGLSNDDASIPMIAFTRKEMAVLGSRNSTAEFPASVDLVTRNQDSFAQLISHRFEWEQAKAAFELATQRPSEVEKVMINVLTPS